jgi:hypothetical protein
MTFSDICSELEKVGQEEENPFPIDDSNKLLHLFDAFDRTDSIIRKITAGMAIARIASSSL